MKLVGAKNPRMKIKIKKVIKPLSKITSENLICHLHIPQHRKGISLLNIIIQNIMEKRKCEGKGS
jgi:hypothetical protein